jgi:hypothetical protein
MKTIKKITALFVLLVGIFSFTRIESNPAKNSVNLNQIDVIETLNNEYFECRPSSKIMFYVESTVLKKYRGYNVVKADVKLLDRISGKSRLLASKNVVIPFSKDAILEIVEINDTSNNIILKNGDTLLNAEKTNDYHFNDLVQYSSIYNSYINSTNKLLNTTRAQN